MGTRRGAIMRYRQQLTPRQLHIDDLLDWWARVDPSEYAMHGWPSQSPQHALQRDKIDGVGPSSKRGMSCREMRAARVDIMTMPERCAHGAGRLYQIDNIVRTMLIERHQMIVHARYVRGCDSHAEVAAALGLNAAYVGQAFVDILDQIDGLMFERAEGRCAVTA